MKTQQLIDRLNDPDIYVDAIDEAIHHMEDMREALEFYADQAHHVITGASSILGSVTFHLGSVAVDGGQKAREALGLDQTLPT